jgi:hypothetical protein
LHPEPAHAAHEPGLWVICGTSSPPVCCQSVAIGDQLIERHAKHYDTIEGIPEVHRSPVALNGSHSVGAALLLRLGFVCVGSRIPHGRTIDGITIALVGESLSFRVLELETQLTGALAIARHSWQCEPHEEGDRNRKLQKPFHSQSQSRL